MRLVRLTLPIVFCLPIGFAQQTQILFEGARLVNGDGSVTENSAFLIANGKFTSDRQKGRRESARGSGARRLGRKP